MSLFLLCFGKCCSLWLALLPHLLWLIVCNCVSTSLINLSDVFLSQKKFFASFTHQERLHHPGVTTADGSTFDLAQHSFPFFLGWACILLVLNQEYFPYKMTPQPQSCLDATLLISSANEFRSHILNITKHNIIKQNITTHWKLIQIEVGNTRTFTTIK